MNELEQQLKDALRRCEPPPHFAQRVLARVAQQTSPQEDAHRAREARSGMWRWPMLRWAVAATMTVLFVAGLAYRVHEKNAEEAQALAAKREVMLALRITGSKLRMAKQRVRVMEDGQEKSGKTL